jgi:hypothetical protein
VYRLPRLPGGGGAASLSGYVNTAEAYGSDFLHGIENVENIRRDIS